MNVLGICSGVGALSLGVQIAEPRARTVAHVEIEASAAASMVASMEAGRLHPAAIWSDLRTFDAGAWRGAVDCVLSGDPCQGNSVAGKRLGQLDDRWLLDRAIDVFDQSGAAVFFRENVPGNLAGQLEVAIPALERLGCRIACGIFSAAEAGASHRRERFFILADRSHLRHERGGRAWRRRPGSEDCGGSLDDAERAERRADRIACDREGQDAHPGGRHEGAAWAGASGTDMVNANGAHAQGRRASGDARGRQEPARYARLASGGLGEGRPRFRHDRPFAPGPADPIWAEIVRDAPSLEPAVCRVAHGMAGRIERLRHCGNGVVPITAALAWVRLHGLLADAAAGDAVRFADDRTARAGAASVRAA